MVRFIYSLYRKLSRSFWTWNTKRKVVSCGKNLKVNYRSCFSGKVFMGNNCNFNGLNIVGETVLKVSDQ